MMTEKKAIIDNLSRLIYNKLQLLSNEQKYPGSCVDTMDDNLKRYEKQYKGLKKIRDAFEILITDTIIKGK
jgi:hypothetical protein